MSAAAGDEELMEIDFVEIRESRHVRSVKPYQIEFEAFPPPLYVSASGSNTPRLSLFRLGTGHSAVFEPLVSPIIVITFIFR